MFEAILHSLTLVSIVIVICVTVFRVADLVLMQKMTRNSQDREAPQMSEIKKELSDIKTQLTALTLKDGFKLR